MEERSPVLKRPLVAELMQYLNADTRITYQEDASQKLKGDLRYENNRKIL
jgi:hypothetical protein